MQVEGLPAAMGGPTTRALDGWLQLLALSQPSFLGLRVPQLFCGLSVRWSLLLSQDVALGLVSSFTHSLYILSSEEFLKEPASGF